MGVAALILVAGVRAGVGLGEVGPGPVRRRIAGLYWPNPPSDQQKGRSNGTERVSFGPKLRHGGCERPM